MAFNPGGTNYTGFLDQRRMADKGTTEALDAKGKAEKAKRIADSKKRSGGQKLLSAVARGAAAYYTGGMSETMGGGDMIDKAMLGADAEPNEYGQMVGMASQVGGAMSAKKGMEMTTKLAAQDKADAAMQTRMDNLDPSGKMGMDFAMKREIKNKQNLEAMEAGKKGSFGGLFQGDIEGVNLEPTSVGDWEAQIKKNEGGIMNTGDAQTNPSASSITTASSVSPEANMGAGQSSSIKAPIQSAAPSQADMAKKLADQSRMQDQQLSDAGAKRPDAFSTYQDWAGNPGSKFVQGGATNRGVKRRLPTHDPHSL